MYQYTRQRQQYWHYKQTPLSTRVRPGSRIGFPAETETHVTIISPRKGFSLFSLPPSFLLFAPYLSWFPFPSPDVIMPVSSSPPCCFVCAAICPSRVGMIVFYILIAAFLISLRHLYSSAFQIYIYIFLVTRSCILVLSFSSCFVVVLRSRTRYADVSLDFYNSWIFEIFFGFCFFLSHSLWLHIYYGGHSNEDHILFVKIGKYIGFCVYPRSYLIWSPVMVSL